MFNFVISRYKEDVKWVRVVLAILPPDLSKLYLYNKGLPNELDSIPLPNIGRESHTYLHHIIQQYDAMLATPDEITYFLQGSIREHIPSKYKGNIEQYMMELTKDTCAHGTPTSFAKDHQFGIHSAVHSFRIKEWSGRKQTPPPDNACFGDWFRQYIDPVFPPKVLWWVAAIFAAKHSAITRRPKSYYEKIINQLKTCDEEAGHYLERSWYYMFTPEPQLL